VDLKKYFSGQHVLVTGGSSGIGLAIARRLRVLGASVTLVARNPERLSKAQKDLTESPGPDVWMLPLDIADAGQVEEVLSEHLKKHPARMIINNAGIARPGRFLELDPKHFREQMDVNYFGAVNVCRVAVPHLVKQGGGHIVNIGSLLSVMGIYGYSAYAASKFALYGFSEVLRAELSSHDIRVTVVLPPDTDTPQHSFELEYLPPETKAIAGTVKMLEPERVAECTLRGMARGAFEVVPGFDGRFTVAMNRISPRLVRWFCDNAQRKAEKKARLYPETSTTAHSS
jgi:3-dehydrosphinganine reductase